MDRGTRLSGQTASCFPRREPPVSLLIMLHLNEEGEPTVLFFDADREGAPRVYRNVFPRFAALLNSLIDERSLRKPG